MTQDELKSILHYNPETGIFTRLKPHGIKPKDGIAGHVDKDGYRRISAHGKKYLAHRLAWFYVYGHFPEFLDHIDGNPANDRIENLRVATRSQNMGNSKKPTNNTSGYKGVSWHRRNKKWSAYVSLDNKIHHLGYYDTPEDAHKAYCNGAKKLHGEFFSDGL